MAAVYITFSALFTALANYLIRRGFDGAKDGFHVSRDPFILHRFLTASFFAILIILYQSGTLSFDPYMSLIAVGAGLCLGFLQYGIGRCLYYGPSGLTFIFVSSSCVLPALIMFFLFGKEYGHNYSLKNGCGSLLVLISLYWMGKSQDLGGFVHFKKWLMWMGIAFGSFTLYQVILQTRALMVLEQHSDAFMPITFLVAAICQMFFGHEKQTTSKNQLLICGILAGVLSGVSTFFLLLGTEFAFTESEKAILFPLNTVLLITACNLWAKFFYNEKINWPANMLAAAGIIIAC